MDEDKVLAALAAMQASMDAFRGEVVARFERVEDALTSIKADISVVSFSAMRQWSDRRATVRRCGISARW